MRDDSTSVRNLVIGMLLVAAPFAISYLLTRGNPYSEILLIVAIFCAGLALMFAMASGLQQVTGVALRLSGRSPRDIMIVGLAALSLLTPWTIAVDVANLHQVFGWTNPLAWLTALGLLTSVTQNARPYHGWALVAAGVAFLGWIGWAGFVLTTPSFSKWPFSFTPVDLVSTGWYAGLIGWVIAVDAFAAPRAREPTLAQPKDVWPLALVPGMGLVRLGYAGRGRLWLRAAALAGGLNPRSPPPPPPVSHPAQPRAPPPGRGPPPLRRAAPRRCP